MEYELLQRFFKGECTAGETAVVEEWLAAEDQDLSVMHRVLDDAWQEPVDQKLGDTDSDRVLQTIKKRMIPQRSGRLINMRQRIIRATAVAAGIAILIVAGAGLLLNKKQAHSGKSLAGITTWKTIRNESINSRKIIMPDGTGVWLAPFSALYYNTPYGSTGRQVKLEGEAYFEVARDEKHPFTVYTDNIATRVLGTAFNIEAYPTEPAIRVSLTSGKVAVNNTDTLYSQKVHVLEPGRMLAYSRDNHDMEIQPVAVKDKNIWKKGYMVLNDIPLEQAISRVARRYGWTVSFAGNREVFANKKVTAVFRNETGEQMIQNLLFIHGCHFKLNGNDLLIME